MLKLKTPIISTLVIILMLFSWTVSGQVVINEIMAANETTFPDNNGAYYDWIELYNMGDQAVHLLDWHLSDKTDNPTRWTLPDIWLQPQEFLLIFASDKDEFDGLYWHTNFKLDNDGEAVVLTLPNGDSSDLVVFPQLSDDESYGRLPDGSNSFSYFQSPTPLGPNQPDGSSPGLYVNLNFSIPPGLYTEKVDLMIIADEPDVEIRYTLDGREPDISDHLFSGPLILSADDAPLSQLAYVASSKDWESPKGEVLAHHVLRAKPYRQGQAVGKAITGTYFFRENFPYNLPVVNITTPPDSLFSNSRGIYHVGEDENYFKRGRDWERPAHFEYFDDQGTLLLQQSIGIRVSGFTTRAYPQKTLKLYARSDYGPTHFNYPFFGENYDTSFKRLALRTLSGDWSQLGFSDDFCHQLILDETTADHARRHFVVVLINGEYWGIHSFREFVDHHFMAHKAGVDDDEINFHINWDANYASEGNPVAYQELIEYIDQANFSEEEDFTRVSEMIDLENFIDYHVLQLSLANGDWPNNNVKIWSPQSADGKWRLAVSDLDGTLKAPNLAVLHYYFAEQRYLIPDWERREKSFYILRKLWDYRPFRQRFIARLNHFLTTTMSPDRSLALLDQMKMELLPEMTRHINRWHYPKSMDNWKKAIGQVESFLMARPAFMLNDAMNWLGPPVHLYPNPATDRIYLDLQSNENGQLQLGLVDIGGREIFKDVQSFIKGKSILEIDFPPGLASGIYYLKINDGRISWVEKVVIGR